MWRRIAMKIKRCSAIRRLWIRATIQFRNRWVSLPLARPVCPDSGDKVEPIKHPVMGVKFHSKLWDLREVRGSHSYMRLRPSSCWSLMLLDADLSLKGGSVLFRYCRTWWDAHIFVAFRRWGWSIASLRILKQKWQIMGCWKPRFPGFDL